jgi:hypothetical protein
LEFVEDMTANDAFDYITSQAPLVTQFKDIYY